MLRKSFQQGRSGLCRSGAGSSSRHFTWKPNKEYLGKALTGSFYLKRDAITDRETVDVYSQTVYNPQSKQEGMQDATLGMTHQL